MRHCSSCQRGMIGHEVSRFPASKPRVSKRFVFSTEFCGQSTAVISSRSYSVSTPTDFWNRSPDRDDFEIVSTNPHLGLPQRLWKRFYV